MNNKISFLCFTLLIEISLQQDPDLEIGICHLPPIDQTRMFSGINHILS